MIGNSILWFATHPLECLLVLIIVGFSAWLGLAAARTKPWWQRPLVIIVCLGVFSLYVHALDYAVEAATHHTEEEK